MKKCYKYSRRDWTSYIQQNERRLTVLITSCSAPAFSNTLLKDRYKWPLLLPIKPYNLCKVLACSTAFFQLSLSCATFFQLRAFILLIPSKTSSSQRVLGLPIGLLDMGFQLLIFWTLLSSAMRSTWPNQFNGYKWRGDEVEGDSSYWTALRKQGRTGSWTRKH